MKEIKHTANKLQEFITQGKEVLLKTPLKKIRVNIRYNNNDTDGTLKWILMISGDVFYTSEIIINTPTVTESVNIEGVGIKHHIACLATEIRFENNKAVIS
jgi:hypothetical protein